MAKVFYERANPNGTVQSAGHRATVVPAPRYRKVGRGKVQVSQ